MASQEELDREQELLRLTQQRAGIQEDILEDVRDIGNTISTQLQNLKFERAERTEIRSLTREINKTATENYNVSLKELGSQKQIAKLAKDRANLDKQLLSLNKLQKQFSKGRTQSEQDLAFALGEQIVFTQKLIGNLAQVESQSKAIANNFSVKTFEGLNKIIKDIPILRQFAVPFEAAANASRIVVAENSRLDNLLQKRAEVFDLSNKSGKGVTKEKIKELGLEKELEGLSGRKAILKANELGLTKKIKGKQDETLAGTKELSVAFSRMASTAVLGAVINSLLKLNKAQTDFRRNTGASISQIDTLNTSLITSVDYIEQANSLVEQFGFNAGVAFSNINIQEAAELTQLMGLSAEEANNLAMFSQANGESLKENAAQAYQNISPLLSQRKVLQEIASIAPSIAMSFGGSAEELAKAASNARLLGLNLSQVDKIADGLLEIEQSLTSEFEAEVITGKQLNLERARFFALTNDIDGVTKEIAANQEVINSFATGTRIEQQAIADAIGLSRDDISKMIFDQQILNGLSEAEAARKSGMSIEDAKRLTIQESINKSIAKMSELLAFPLEMLAGMVENAGILYGIMVGIGTIAAVSFAKSLGKALVSMIAIIPKAALLLKIKTGTAVAALTELSATTLGLGAIAAVAGVGLAVSAFKAMQNVNDGIADSSKGPFTITDSFGATAVTAKGDGVVVSPNIQKEVGINPSTPTTPQPKEVGNTIVSEAPTTNLIEIKGLDKLSSTISNQESQPLEIRGIDKILSFLSIPKPTQPKETDSSPSTLTITQPLEIRGIDKILSFLSIPKPTQPKEVGITTPTPTATQPKEVGIKPTLPSNTETKLIEVKGLDKILSFLSLQKQPTTELNESTSIPIQQERLGFESKLPTTPPTQEIRGAERNSSSNITVTLSKEDIESIADAVKDGASKANINVNLDGNRVSNALQIPQAMNTREYSV